MIIERFEDTFANSGKRRFWFDTGEVIYGPFETELDRQAVINALQNGKNVLFAVCNNPATNTFVDMWSLNFDR